jgi:phosphoglycolate phosphatase-like HAD superfamily hydrolase
MFDFDGVIADSLDGMSEAYVDTLRARGFANLATRERFLDFHERNWFGALADAGVPEDVVNEVEDAFVASPSPPFFHDMPSVLDRLAEANRVAIITSSRTSVVEAALAEHGVTVAIDVLGGEVEASKTRKIESVRRRSGYETPACYVCDTTGDILEAKAAGVSTVGVVWVWHGESRLRRACPDRIVHTPGDLLDLFPR